MEQNNDVQTDAVDEDELVEWGGNFSKCNGFAFWYVENVNKNAVVKDAYTVFGQEHCYVYDPDLDATIDPTLGQFDDAPFVGAWDGDTHPYADDAEEVYEWDSKDEFKQHYDRAGSPYIVK